MDITIKNCPKCGYRKEMQNDNCDAVTHVNNRSRKRWPEMRSDYLKRSIHELNETEFAHMINEGSMMTPSSMEALEVLFTKGLKEAIEFEVGRYPELYKEDNFTQI